MEIHTYVTAAAIFGTSGPQEVAPPILKRQKLNPDGHEYNTHCKFHSRVSFEKDTKNIKVHKQSTFYKVISGRFGPFLHRKKTYKLCFFYLWTLFLTKKGYYRFNLKSKYV